MRLGFSAVKFAMSKLRDCALCSFSREGRGKKKKKKSKAALWQTWVNLWFRIIVSMTKPAWWWAVKWIYKSSSLKYVHKQLQTHTITPRANKLRGGTRTQKQPSCTSLGPLDHALHPHPLSKKPKVNSFPYSLSLSHPASFFIRYSHYSIWRQFWLNALTKILQS